MDNEIIKHETPLPVLVLTITFKKYRIISNLTNTRKIIILANVRYN